METKSATDDTEDGREVIEKTLSISLSSSIESPGTSSPIALDS